MAERGAAPRAPGGSRRLHARWRSLWEDMPEVWWARSDRPDWWCARPGTSFQEPEVGSSAGSSTAIREAAAPRMVSGGSASHTWPGRHRQQDQWQTCCFGLCAAAVGCSGQTAPQQALRTGHRLGTGRSRAAAAAAPLRRTGKLHWWAHLRWARRRCARAGRCQRGRRAAGSPPCWPGPASPPSCPRTPATCCARAPPKPPRSLHSRVGVSAAVLGLRSPLPCWGVQAWPGGRGRRPGPPPCFAGVCRVQLWPERSGAGSGPSALRPPAAVQSSATAQAAPVSSSREPGPGRLAGSGSYSNGFTSGTVPSATGAHRSAGMGTSASLDLPQRPCSAAVAALGTGRGPTGSRMAEPAGRPGACTWSPVQDCSPLADALGGPQRERAGPACEGAGAGRMLRAARAWCQRGAARRAPGRSGA